MYTQRKSKLRFKFTPEVFKANFTPDRTMPKGCFYTKKPISPLHLGVNGSLLQGLNLGMFSRMVQHPSRMLRGVVFLGAAAYVGKRTYRYITNQPQPETSSQHPKEAPNLLKEATIPIKTGLPDEAKNLITISTSPTIVSNSADLNKQKEKKPSIGMRIRNLVANGLFFRVIGHQFIAF
ncbi:MAG TPA: hypothetical protein VGO47_05080, partial [Chlamydiales bacterium]|nr:hypothetical protein [Chlamydiales bacterium]